MAQVATSYPALDICPRMNDFSQLVSVLPAKAWIFRLTRRIGRCTWNYHGCYLQLPINLACSFRIGLVLLSLRPDILSTGTPDTSSQNLDPNTLLLPYRLWPDKLHF